MKKERVVILGASDQPRRYAFQAFRLLREHGHEVVPVHPGLAEIEGVPVAASLREVTGPIDTLTLYVRPEIAEAALSDLLAAAPGRVVFNPGTESGRIKEALAGAGIAAVEDCTLVMLREGRF